MLAGLIAIKLGYGGHEIMIFWWWAFCGLFALCALEVYRYLGRTALLKDPNFNQSQLTYKCKHDLKTLEMHARMIGETEKAQLIVAYLADRAASLTE